MPTRGASAELLAPPEDVWAFLSEPRHLADWWPNLSTVEPDRRGFSVGARWRVRSRRSTWVRRAEADDTLLVHVVEPSRRFAFELVRARLEADLRLAPESPGHTRVELTVSGPFFSGFASRLPAEALDRLHDLVQTAAEL